jgi:hypothetical protein
LQKGHGTVVKKYSIETLEKADISTQYKQQLSNEILKIGNGLAGLSGHRFHPGTSFLTRYTEGFHALRNNSTHVFPVSDDPVFERH